jgi:rod shape-determining protein MreC
VKIWKSIQIFIEKRNVLIKHGKIVNLTVIILVLILLVTIGVTTSGHSTFLEGSGFGNIAAPIQKVFYSVGQIFSNSFESLFSISKIREENNQLKEELYKIRDENLDMKRIINNSEALKLEYEMIQNMQYDYVKSRIISRDPGNWFGRFTIDKGSSDGVKPDDIVIEAIATDEGVAKIGLVGKVTDVGYNWAKVIAINDINSSVSFKVVRNNESGVLKGKIDGIIEGYFFNKTEDLRIGDQVVTSGLGEVYVPNLFIGKISKIEKTSDLLTEEITVEPAINFEKLFEVYIIKVSR